MKFKWLTKTSVQFKWQYDVPVCLWLNASASVFSLIDIKNEEPYGLNLGECNFMMTTVSTGLISQTSTYREEPSEPVSKQMEKKKIKREKKNLPIALCLNEIACINKG